jgi:hypothetical protein
MAQDIKNWNPDDKSEWENTNNSSASDSEDENK